MSTEKENKAPQAEEPKRVQAGDLLRTKREELGISQEEIADRLCLRVSTIQSIDQNNFELDQVATFTRGYLRSYARAVSLDDKVVLAALDNASEAQHLDHKMQSFSRKTKREKSDSRIMKLTWIIFVIIIGISSVWWYQNQQDTLIESSNNDQPAELTPKVDEPASPVRAEPASPVRAEPASPARPEPASPEVEPVTLPAELDTPEEAATQDEGADEAAVVEEEVVVATTEPEPTESIANELVMRFNADCWIQVKDATGKTLSSGVKQGGRIVNLTGEPPYKVILGAPEGVSMTFASEPVDLSGYTAGKVARFTLP